MGGPGSGRTPDVVNPKKRKVNVDPVAQLTEATGAATAIAQAMPTAKERDAARKREERAKAKDDAPRKKFPKPEQFKDHPLAQALNTFADQAAGVAGSGAAASSMLGESWMAVVDYYFTGPDHPLIIATIATAQFGAVAWNVKAMQKQKAQGPNSPNGQAIVPPVVKDETCFQCQQVFPDAGLLHDHIRKDHA